MHRLGLGRAFLILPTLLGAACRHVSGEAVDSANQCPASWLEPPVVDPAIAVPSRSARVLFHAAAVGSLIYVCRPSADDPSGPWAWRSVLPPEGSLVGCKGTVVGRLFENKDWDPVWQLNDGAYVVADETASSPRGDWIGSLLLVAKTTLPYDPAGIAYMPVKGANGPFGETRYVHQVHTMGGLPPTDACGRFSPTDRKVIPYMADYYFYGP